ncbi:MAG: 30S ribosomal protein S20 [Candidatus Binataceae bacterium]|jgi:small subunit ribosomal protein S20
MPHIPVHPSAEKRFRQSVKRHLRNHAIKMRLRTITKGALEAIQGSDKEAAAAGLRQAMKVLGKAASKGVIRKNTASRRIARLSKRLHKAHGAAKAEG